MKIHYITDDCIFQNNEIKQILLFYFNIYNALHCNIIICFFIQGEYYYWCDHEV